MTEQIKRAIEELEFDMECGEFYNPSMADSVRFAIRSLNAWSEVLNELEKEKEKEIKWGMDAQAPFYFQRIIDIINQHLAEIEEEE